MGDLNRGSKGKKNDPASALAHGEQQDTSQPSQDRPRLRRDPDAAPDGYDANVWYLAVYFQRLAEERGFELATGRPVIYFRLQERIVRSPLSDKRGADLIGILEEIMLAFWDDEVWLSNTRYALDQFCGVETFIRLAEWALGQRQAGVKIPGKHGVGPSEAGQRRRAERRARVNRNTRPDAWEQALSRARDYLERNGK